MRLRILIVDDHEVARAGLHQLLADSPIEIAAVCESGPAALAAVGAADLHAALVDVRMPGHDGLTLLSKLRQARGDLPVVMMSAFDNPTYLARACALKANDYVLKSDTRDTFVEAITRAVRRETAMPGYPFFRIQHALMSETVPDELPQQSPLTRREAQVLRHVGLGLSNKEIACSLDISIETVKEHVQKMLRKINANDRTAAAVRAVRCGLVG